ncbi:type III-B CRISPR module-associated protein Cmr3 [Candidatus Poribacteria bacterium]|nr:MAG: type III-B CRISPR module-associated protein Cmr3 [Candidatus Poribacteria bacterium]
MYQFFGNYYFYLKGVKVRLFLQANDTFFFRDGRPFTKGDQSEGYSIFPPLPSTILGALRTAYIAEHGDLSAFYAGKMAMTIGTPNSLGSINLNGVFLADRESTIYYPIPLDLVVKKNETANKLYILEVGTESSNHSSNASLPCLLKWFSAEDVESETNGRLEGIVMTEYLLSRHKEFDFRPIEDFVRSEPKIGIERDYRTSAAKDNMLYRINLSRFQSQFIKTKERKALSDLGFVVDYECDIELPENGMLKLGGEGKSFTYKQSFYNPDPLAAEEDMAALKETISSSGVFKLYFATPAIFNHGWLPEWIDKTTYNAQYDSLSFELITAAVGKPIAIGGWDMKKNMPKPTYQAIPAGSVYYFKISDGSCIDSIVNTFHYKNISDRQAKEGFGLCFVAVSNGNRT